MVMGRAKVSLESRSNNAGMSWHIPNIQRLCTWEKRSQRLGHAHKPSTPWQLILIFGQVLGCNCLALKSKPASEWTRPSAPEIHAVACLNAYTNKLFVFHATMNERCSNLIPGGLQLGQNRSNASGRGFFSPGKCAIHVRTFTSCNHQHHHHHHHHHSQ